MNAGTAASCILANGTAARNTAADTPATANASRRSARSAGAVEMKAPASAAGLPATPAPALSDPTASSWEPGRAARANPDQATNPPFFKVFPRKSYRPAQTLSVGKCRLPQESRRNEQLLHTAATRGW